VITPRAIVVSIHDVAPPTQGRVEQILAELTEEGVLQSSLLVVPNYHHTGNSLGRREFVQWLKTLETAGHEIVLHGFYHQRARRAGESLLRKLITRIYTADEGEFFDLDYAEALQLLQTALAKFARNGFHPTGFVAPAWLLGAEAERAVRAAGFRYTTTLGTVRDFVSGMEFRSQSLVYSVRRRWRSALSLLWNRPLFRRLRTNPLLRLSLHPPDLDEDKVWRQIRWLLREAMRDRHSMTYQGWLGARDAAANQTLSLP
jgi:predicted deacetylase